MATGTEGFDPEQAAQPGLLERFWSQLKETYSDGVFWTSRLYRAAGGICIYVAFSAWLAGATPRAAVSAALVLPLIVTGRSLRGEKRWAWKAAMVLGGVGLAWTGFEAVVQRSWTAIVAFGVFGGLLHYLYGERARFLGVAASSQATIPLATNAPGDWPDLKTSEGLSETDPQEARAMLQVKIGSELKRAWEAGGGEVLAFGEEVRTSEGSMETDILVRSPDRQRWALFVFPRAGRAARERWATVSEAFEDHPTTRAAYLAPEHLG